MSERKTSPYSMVGSAIFITCMAIFGLKLFGFVDLGVSTSVLLAGLAVSWIMREIGWAKERVTNA